MPEQILPLSGLDQAGVILDTPSVALPPTAFSDALNVRFKDGAVRKMEGELDILPELVRTITSDIERLILNQMTMMDELTDQVYVVLPDSTFVIVGSYPAVVGRENSIGNWQHTFFQGGFSVVINNGLMAPQYITDADGNIDINALATPGFQDLPGWESYNVVYYRLDDTFGANDLPIFDTRRVAIGTDERVSVIRRRTVAGDIETAVYAEVSPANRTDTLPASLTPPAAIPGGTSGTDQEQYKFYTDRGQLTLVIGGLQTGDQIEVEIRTANTVNTTARVIRSYGNVLVAGNLEERDSVSGDVVRNLPGIVRISDAAAPGNIPNNWNPFAAGVSTADEFVISDTGIVQDLVELQGNLYIYSNTSISVLRPTGSATVPFAVTNVTDAYGAQTTNSVIEFDGQHFVVGSQDIYIFGGHPGSIQSVADTRVRRRFYELLNPLEEDRLFCFRYQQRDEIWVCFPTTSSLGGEADRAFIWNYRSNTWTIRELRNVISGNIAPVPGGGVPNSSVPISGMSGTNEEIDPGVISTQTLTSTHNIAAGATFEHHTWTITVTDVPTFSGSGSERWVLDVPIGYDSGNNPSQSIIFTLRNSNALISGWPRVVTLPDNTTLRDQVVSAINSQVGTHYTATAGDSPTNINVVSTASTDAITHDFHALSIGTTPTAQSAFTAAGQTAEMITVTPNSNGEAVQSIVVPAGSGPRFVFIPDNVRAFTDPTVGTNTNFYRTSVASDLFFASITPTATQFATSTRTYSEVSSPIEVTETQSIYFRFVNASNNPITADVVLNVFNSLGTTNSVGSISVNNIPGGSESNIGPPEQVNITSGLVLYNTTTDAFDTNQDPITISSQLIGDVTALTQTERNDFVASLINQSINTDANFTSTVSNNVVTVSHHIPGLRYLEVTPPGTDSTSLAFRGTFTVATTLDGVYEYNGEDLAIGSIQPILPTVTISGITEFAGSEPSMSFVFPAIVGDGFSSTEVTQAIGAQIAMVSGWGYTSPNIVMTTDIDATQQDMTAQRPIQGTWAARPTVLGNVTINRSNLSLDTDLVTATVSAASTPNTGAHPNSGGGRFPIYAVPSFLGIRVNTGSTGATEFIVARAGALNNTTILSAEQTVDAWVSKIRQANRALRVESSGSGNTSSLTIQPVNYDEAANFVVELFSNTNTLGEQNAVANAASLQAAVNQAMTDGTLNPYSDPLYFNPGSTVLSANTVDQSGASNNASISIGNFTISQVLDLLRPWPTDEINPNQEYPLFAESKIFDVVVNGVGSGTRVVNKIIGADIGWQVPMFGLDDQNKELMGETSYGSYVERVQFPISPEFSTEHVGSIALWADGSTQQAFRGPEFYNVLRLSVDTTNSPGLPVDLTADTAFSNEFPISEEYKMDVRRHGRFFNFRISDDGTTIPEGMFSAAAEWRISGIQIEFAIGGRR